MPLPNAVVVIITLDVLSGLAKANTIFSVMQYTVHLSSNLYLTKIPYTLKQLPNGYGSI